MSGDEAVSGDAAASAGDTGASMRSGYHAAPSRPVWLTVVLVAAVVVFAAWFAHLFRDTAQHVIEWYAGTGDPTAAAASLRWYVLFGLVTVTVFVAAWMGRFIERFFGNRTGVEAVAASARGEGRNISLRATWVRSAATWSTSVGLVSIGRESAIIESGGAIGAIVGKRSGGRGDALATAGIAAAFAAAYHAPIAGMLYVEEHLRVHTSRRALVFASAGAAGGHAASVYLFGGHAIFPPTEGSRWRMLVLGMIALLPALLAARLFLELRVRVKALSIADRLGVPWWAIVLPFAIVAGAAVATFPLAAGNGMEALRQVPLGVTAGTGLALCFGKLAGTTASIGGGAPGGVLTPTISIASGAALLTLLAVEQVGVVVDNPWDPLVLAMAVGVAVGLRSPYGAVFLLPEMLGDYTLVPVVAVVVALAFVIDRGIDRIVVSAGERLPSGIYDEDA